MGRHRLSTAVLEARGAFVTNPDRTRDPEPNNKNPIGAAPGHFTKSEAEAWMQVCQDCAPGVLTQSERIMVEILAKLLADVRSNPESATTAKFGRIESLIGKLGMTPADRQRVGVAPPKDASDFDDL